jgi:hypothetical protein
MNFRGKRIIAFAQDFERQIPEASVGDDRGSPERLVRNELSDFSEL